MSNQSELCIKFQMGSVKGKTALGHLPVPARPSMWLEELQICKPQVPLKLGSLPHWATGQTALIRRKAATIQKLKLVSFSPQETGGLYDEVLPYAVFGREDIKKNACCQNVNACQK